MQLIEADQIDGHTCYTATRRGVEYCAWTNDGASWTVFSQRIALRAARMGGGSKRYDSLSALVSGCKAFEGLDLMIGSCAAVEA